jgi:hypothetical protein
MVSAELPVRDRRGAWATIAARLSPHVAALAWYGVFIARSSGIADGRRVFPLFDDAMISMTYARNLASGHGLVWNAGGPRVEGITNILWTLLMAVPHWLNVPDRYTGLVMAVLGAVLLCLCAELGRAIVARLAHDSPLASAAAPWLICFCYPLVYWTLRGMEVGLVTALALAAVLLALRLAQRPRSPDLVGLAAVIAAGLWTRLDFAVFVPAILAFHASALAAGVRRRVLAVTVLATLGTIATQELARFAYYGRWLPNTYLLKIANTGLFDRFDRGFRSVLFTLAATGAGAAIFAGVALWRRRNAGLLLPVLCAAAVGMYDTYVGGDAWEEMLYANRYLTPGLVLLLCVAAVGVCDFAETCSRPRIRMAVLGGLTGAAILVALGLGPLGNTLFRLPPSPGLGAQPLALLPLVLLLLVRPGRRMAASSQRLSLLLLVGLGLAVNLFPLSRWMSEGAICVDDDLVSVRVGLELASVTSPEASLAVTAAGNIIYFARRPGVDLYGKSDPAVAAGPVRPEVGFFPGHMKWNSAISIGRHRPDVIVQLPPVNCTELRLLVNAGYVAERLNGPVGSSALPRPYLIRLDSVRILRDRLLTSTPQLTAAMLLGSC